MSANLTLSPTLRARLTAVARRIYLLRAVRGVSVFVLFLALTAGAALIADDLSGQQMPALLRQINLSAWLGLGAAVLIGGLILPLCRRLDAEALAAVIERKYPELAERLTTSVELAGDPGAGHGSAALIALLLRETEEQTSRLNFLPAVSPKTAGILAGAAGVVLVLFAIPAVVWSEQFNELGHRFLSPWETTAAASPYAFEVSPGNKIVAVGDGVDFNVRIKTTNRRASLPETAYLVLQTPVGEKRIFMPRRGAGVFTVRDFKDFKDDFTYHIEANDSASSDFDVTAVTKVGLAKDSPKVSIVLPQYAQHTENLDLRPAPRMSLVEFKGLQHSEALFEVAFDRPAVAAYVEWTPAGSTDAVPYRVVLAEDRLSGTATVPLKTAGSYRLILEAEHGIRTEIDGPKGDIILDRMPYFVPGTVKIGGDKEPVTALAYDHIPIHAQFRDDVGTGRLDLEYYVLPLAAQGGREKRHHRVDPVARRRPDERDDR